MVNNGLIWGTLPVFIWKPLIKEWMKKWNIFLANLSSTFSLILVSFIKALDGKLALPLIIIASHWACSSDIDNIPPVAGCTKPINASSGPISGLNTCLYSWKINHKYHQTKKCKLAYSYHFSIPIFHTSTDSLYMVHLYQRPLTRQISEIFNIRYYGSLIQTMYYVYSRCPYMNRLIHGASLPKAQNLDII